MPEQFSPATANDLYPVFVVAPDVITICSGFDEAVVPEPAQEDAARQSASNKRDKPAFLLKVITLYSLIIRCQSAICQVKELGKILFTCPAPSSDGENILTQIIDYRKNSRVQLTPNSAM